MNRSPSPDPSGPTSRGRSSLLAINVGSSSLKFAVFAADEPTERIATGRVEKIGRPDASWSATEVGGSAESREIDAADLGGAVSALFDWLGRTGHLGSLRGVGHRVVHGGPGYSEPERVTPELIAELHRLVPLDPDHLAGEIAAIEAFRGHDPALPQVACFDTAFHRDMPRVAQLLAIPRRFAAEGVRRYGFHGLSYAFLMEALGKVAGAEAANGRVILAHLGSGASLAAVRGGKSVDTTMGFTPAAGLVMGTRTGDIDPGLVRFLMRSGAMTAEQFDHMVNRESGLLGVSETSPDLRDLLARRATDPRAAEAVDLFCQRAKQGIGAFAATLGGLDTLVFSGGIGEHSPEARRQICEGLGFLGIGLDAGRNAANAPVISEDPARVAVRVIPTDEEVMIAGATARLVR